MALQFVVGGAGSGKTRCLYERAIEESMKHPELSYLFVVPEQYTMQTQREIIRLHPRHGVMNIDILSFKRLAYRVFEDLGVQVPVVLDDTGKSMILRKAAGRRRRELTFYGGHLDQAGFINQMKSQISELYQYGLGPDDLAQVREASDRRLLGAKLKDLEILYREFKEYIKTRCITAEEILDILCRELPRWGKLRDSVIFMDGFTGLTPVQYRLARIMIGGAKDVVCALTVDLKEELYRECGIQHLFYMSRHTACRLRDMAKEQGVEKKKDIRCGKRPAWRFTESPALDFLEQNLYRYRSGTWQGDAEAVQMYEGKNPAEEISFVCGQIRRMVQEEGMRFRDAAVVTGDLSSYKGEIAHQFGENEIPYFLDDKKSILENPMVELIRAALDTVRDFSYESVFRYLKTGLVYERGSAPEEGEQESSAQEAYVYTQAYVEEMTDRLENYVRALGIRGWKQWEQPWERRFRGAERFNLEELNAFRQWILAPLARLRQAFRAEGASMGTMAAAVEQYLEEMELEKKLEDCSAFFLERKALGDENLAREYGQVYGLVQELLERLGSLLGEEKAEQKSFIQILDAGFEEIKVGMIPATVDQVMVGDITRSRLEDVKVLFFVGVNEGIVPQRKSGGGILTDADREVFKSFGLTLAPTAREDGCIQKFYLYLMLAKPSRRLVLTWAAMSAGGKSQRPSGLIGEVKRLIPGARRIASEQLPGTVRTERDGKERLIAGLRAYQEGERRDRAFLEVFRYFYSSPAWREETRKLADAAFYSYQEGGIGRAAARALYGPLLQGSVTRLEQFAACAYAHFLKYGLELMERQEYELAAVDMGNLFHQSIDRCFAVMKEEGRDWRTLSEEERKALVKTCVGQVTEEYGNTIMGSTARNAYLAGRVEQMTDRTIWALAEQMKKGDFEPAGFEVSFSAADNLKAMRIRLSEEEELWLKGRIDRLDLCRDGEILYVKIIDYKSGSTSFDLAALYYGLQLQLVVYMDAALELAARDHPGLTPVPAGIFYYHIQDPFVQGQEGMRPEEIEGQILKQLKMNGLVNSELEIIRHLDREIEKESDVIPVAMKDGYVQESRSSVANSRRFEALGRFVSERLKRAGQDILGGAAQVQPYKQGNRTPCDYCPYHAVCGFDTKTAGFGYRRLKSLKLEDIWQEIEKGEEAEDEMDQQAAAGN
mgnify:FL=1